MSDSLNPISDEEQLMLGAIPGKPALGRGPAADGDYSRHDTTILPPGGAQREASPTCSHARASRSRAFARSS